VHLATVTHIDVRSKMVHTKNDTVPYNTLIVATGMSHNYLGHSAWESLAPGLKTVEDATEIRRRILYAFEAAESEKDPQKVQQWLTFVIIGGGPTGVELAGAVGEIARFTLKHNFRSINPAHAKIVLLEAGQRILSTYPHHLATCAQRDLKRLGVVLFTDTMVTDIKKEAVTIQRHGSKERSIACRTILWAAGVQASSLGAVLAKQTRTPQDRLGRLLVARDLTLPRYPEIFVIGDLAHAKDQDGQPLPGMAPVAMQQGKYVAKVIRKRLTKQPIPAHFRYRNFGYMATIGRGSAVAVLGRLHLSGYFGWLAWLFIHLMQLVQFQNKLLVLIQWAWNYVTRNRSARLITKERKNIKNRDSH